uniref:RNase H type-1 domain-containing protein n=1 Tax=Solanum lycopersicum TaxID=4081 RepID=A0A3Q7G6H0_SOLLC
MAAIDSCGHLLHAFGTPIQFVGKAIAVETLAILEAMKRALQKSWSKAHILSNAKNVIQIKYCKRS